MDMVPRILDANCLLTSSNITADKYVLPGEKCIFWLYFLGIYFYIFIFIFALEQRVSLWQNLVKPLGKTVLSLIFWKLIKLSLTFCQSLDFS